MKWVKYLMGTLLITMSLIFTGELFIFHLDQFQESYYQATFVFEETTAEASEIISDFLETAKHYDVDFFFVDGEITSDIKKEIKIYGTEGALTTLKNRQIKSQEYGSLFVGTTEVMLRPITEFSDIKKMKSCNFIGEDVEALRAFKGQLVDKYSGGMPKLYASDQQTIANLVLVFGGSLAIILLMSSYEILISKKERMVRYILGEDSRQLVWRNILTDTVVFGGSLAIILLMSSYEILISKKERMVRYILGEDSRQLVWRNILTDTVVFSGSYALGCLVLSKVSNVTFMSSLSFGMLVLFLILNGGLWLWSLKSHLKKDLMKDVDGQRLLVVSYGIKAITFVLTLFLITLNLIVFVEGYDYYQQRDFFKAHKDYAYYQINYRLEEDLTGERTNEIIQKFHQTFKNQSLMYADLSDHESSVRLINEQTKRELLRQQHPMADVLSQCTEEKVYVLIPSSMQQAAGHKSYFQMMVRMYLGEAFTDLSLIEFIPYEEDVRLLGISDPLHTYRSRYSKNPVILLNQTAIQHDPTGNAIYYAYDVMYDLSDEEFSEFIEEYGIQHQILKKTNVYELYQYNWATAKRCMKLTALLSVFMMALECVMILFVLRLEYSFKAMEMVLKKTLGYSLFEREKVLVGLTLLVSFISCLLAMGMHQFLGKEHGIYLIGLSLFLTVIELIYIGYKTRQLERLKMASILKGERI